MCLAKCGWVAYVRNSCCFPELTNVQMTEDLENCLALNGDHYGCGGLSRIMWKAILHSES